MKLQALWERVRDTLWFIPGLIVLGGFLLAPAMAQVDRLLLEAVDVGSLSWLLGGSPDGMRSLLSTIAGSLITVAGVVFSITIIALQLASTQYTPRVLQNFMNERSVQVVMGVFVATFAYCLVLLRTVRSPLDRNVDAFVPAASATLALLLALVCLGFLIYYIDHVARWIQPATIIDRVAHDSLRASSHRTNARATPGDVEPPAGRPSVALAQASGYLQSIDRKRLLRIAVEEKVLIRVDLRVGRFALPDTVLASLWPLQQEAGPPPARLAEPGLLDRVRRSFVFGRRRTITQDVELGVIQLSDIALKGLSPSINDPTTAMMSLDRIGEVVAAIADRAKGPIVLRSEQGAGSVVLDALDFERLAAVAFAQVRRYGGGDPAVAVHLLDTIARVGRSTDTHGRSILRGHVDDVEATVRERIRHQPDLARVLHAVARARRDLAAPD